jgi:hypothetical protein
MYTHTQRGYLIIKLCITLIVASIFVGYVGAQPLVFYPLAFTGVVIYFFFRDLTVEVDSSVRFYFGIGWFKKEFGLGSIVSAKITRNPWWYGWGIHYIFGVGWVYNIGGLDAVELVLTDGKRLRIGTDEPQVLQAEIMKRLAIK